MEVPLDLEAPLATAKAATKKPSKKPAATPASRMTLKETMAALEKAGSAQTRKTYARHGAKEPMFGVSFAFLGTLVKRIGVDQELARGLWETGNFDARNLAMKIADPAQMTPAELDRWARDTGVRMVCLYVASLACEGPHAAAKVDQWLASPDEADRNHGWALLGQMAHRDAAARDAWFSDHLARIERTIHGAPNYERYAMNSALIGIGCRSAALRKAALAAAKRIGKVEVDHGDTACKTPDARESIEKTWAHSTSKGFESPAAHERTRESPRTRC
jgi:3-methyladenine DNA glycosylase AlkD